MHRSNGQRALPMLLCNEQNFSKSINLVTQKCEQLAEGSGSSKDAKTKFLSGFTIDGSFWWQANRSFLLFHNQNHKGSNTISTYNFNINFDQECNITSCCGYKELFIVGLSCEDGTGYVCLFNPLLVKILKIISIPYTVTEVSIISLQGGANKQMKIFYKSLRFLYGMAAVGTAEGHVFILDLRLDDNKNVELYPLQIEIIHPLAKNVPELREANLEQNTHLAVELHRNCHEEGLFYFANQDNEIIEQYYPSDILVTSILFEPRCCLLFVGYSFGQFHIYDLNLMKLLYASELDTNYPVARFAFQEPENDPKNFCYLWVVHGASNSNKNPISVNMFQLMFAEKQILSNPDVCGLLSKKVLYKGLQLCGLRFQEELGEDEDNVVLCQTVEKYNSKPNDPNLSTEEDMCVSPESSVFILGWETISRGKKNFNVLLFDINRWYLAHMPSGISGHRSDEIYSANWITDTSKYDKILASYIGGNNEIKRFYSTAKPPPDNFLEPSAITFNCYIVTANSHLQCRCKGAQKHAIDLLLSNKDACLSEPSAVFEQFASSGLINSIFKSSEALSPKIKREMILSAALEHNLTNFLMYTLQSISMGKFVASGFTLRMMHDWMWFSVQNIKEKINGLCVPIFDCTSTVLDSNIISQFDIFITQICHLKKLFQILLNISVDAEQRDLNTKLMVVSLIYDYISVVRWFITNGLLPEQFGYDGEEHILHRDGIIIYKYEILKSTFAQRRRELSGIENVLMIDHMIQDVGEELTDKWVQAEGESCYPPPSFMDLLNIYYMDSADIMSKHCIVIYFLLDILDVFESNRNLLMSEGNESLFDMDQLTQIGLFPQSFDVPLSVVKLLQGFWYLDHKDFDQSLEKFVASDTAAPYAKWQDSKILESYMKQKQYTHALKFMLACKNKQRGFDNKELQLDVYLKNSNLIAAWKIAQVALHDNESCFINFMMQCEKNNLIKDLLTFPLSKLEEDSILGFLAKSLNSTSQHLMITYFFKRGRYVDGIQAYHHTNLSHGMGANMNKLRKHQINLQKIVRAYSSILPRVERERALNHDKRIMKKSLKKEMFKVKPIKPQIHTGYFDSPVTHSSVLTRRHLGKMESQTDGILITPFRKKGEPKTSNVVEKKITKPKRESISSMLLQTPPMQRRRSRPSLHAAANIEISTPQSILKKRNFSRLATKTRTPVTEEMESQHGDNDVFQLGDAVVENKSDSPEVPLSMRRLSDWLSITNKETKQSNVDDSDTTEDRGQNRNDTMPKKAYLDSVLKISTPQTPKVLRFNLTDDSPSTLISKTIDSTVQMTSNKNIKSQILRFKTDHEDMDVDITGISDDPEEKTHDVTQEKEVLFLSSDTSNDSHDLNLEDEIRPSQPLEEEMHPTADIEREIVDISLPDNEEEEIIDLSDNEELNVSSRSEDFEDPMIGENENEDGVDKNKQIYFEDKDVVKEKVEEDRNDDIIIVDKGLDDADVLNDTVSSNDEENKLFISCTSTESGVDELQFDHSATKLEWKAQEVVDEPDIVIPATSASDGENEIIIQEEVAIDKLGDISQDDVLVSDQKDELSVVYPPPKEFDVQEEAIGSGVLGTVHEEEEKKVLQLGDISSNVDTKDAEKSENKLHLEENQNIADDLTKSEVNITSVKNDEIVVPVSTDTKEEEKPAKSLIIEKLKADPTFVLSPPKIEHAKQRASARKSAQMNRRAVDLSEPTFVFSPPTTRRRSSRRHQESDASVGVLDTSVSSVVSVTFQEKIKKAKSPFRTSSKPETPIRSSARLRSKEILQSDSDVPVVKKSPGRKKTAVNKLTRKSKTPRKFVASETEDTEVDVETIPVIEVTDVVDNLQTIVEDTPDQHLKTKSITHTRQQHAVTPTRRTPSRRAKSKSGYDSSVTDKESTDVQGITTEVETDVPGPEPKKTKTKKTSSTQTKTSTKLLKNRKLLVGKKSWSPGKEGIKLLPIISETEDQTSDDIKPKTTRKTKKKNSSNPSPPKVYSLRTRSQRKTYSIK